MRISPRRAKPHRVIAMLKTGCVMSETGIMRGLRAFCQNGRGDTLALALVNLPGCIHAETGGNTAVLVEQFAGALAPAEALQNEITGVVGHDDLVEAQRNSRTRIGGVRL